MKTHNLQYFQYDNAATTYIVKATEYEFGDGHIEFRLTIVNGEKSVTTSPATRADAMKAAESQIALFLDQMALVYLSKADLLNLAQFVE